MIENSHVDLVNFTRLAGAIRGKRGSDSQTVIAERIGISTPRISTLENETTRCDFAAFAKVCAWLGVPWDYFQIK